MISKVKLYKYEFGLFVFEVYKVLYFYEYCCL